jgi:hypothetical protein
VSAHVSAHSNGRSSLCSPPLGVTRAQGAGRSSKLVMARRCGLGLGPTVAQLLRERQE